VKLLGVEWDNLFCLGKGSEDLESRGLTLVTGFSHDEGGANGSGKSSFANKAVLWTMFGETAGGLRADAVVNRHGKKSCKGRLLFESDDGEKYAIERRRPAKLSLFKGTTDISAHTAKETQLLIDSLLGFDFDTFVQTSVFGQGRHAHYPSLSPQQRKEVLENILPMEEADQWANFTDKAIKELTPKIALVAADIVAAETNLTAIQRQMQISSHEGEAFEAARAHKIEKAEEQIKQTEAVFQCELDGLSVATSMHEETDIEALTNQMELITMESGTWDHYVQEADKKTLEASNSLAQWANKIRLITAEKDDLMGATACVACNRPYDNDSAKLAADRLEALIEEQAEAQAAAKAGHTAHDYWYAEKHKWEQQIQSAKLKAFALEQQIEECRGLEQARERIESKMQIQTAGYQARLDFAKNEENPYVAIYERHASEEDGAKALLTEAETCSAKLIEELDHLKYWKQVYGKDLKLKLFEDACPFLDSRTAYHLSALKNSQIHCEFSTIKRMATGATKEEFDVVVWSETGGRGFDSLSGGEQQMVSFAIGLSLADLASRVGGAESGFLVLDEPFTELDERNAEAVIEYLTAEVENGRDTVLLISNEESLKGLIQNRIHVVKKGGISNVQAN
jgi:DNA repair exonuclease SbcCD ATPase subunit